MAWALLDDNFPHHPKAVKAGNLAAYLFICGLCYCRKYHTGGSIPREAVRTLGIIGNERKLVDALLEAGLWVRTEDGFNVHDYEAVYLNDAADKADKEDRSRKKREAGRKGGLASWAIRSKQSEADASSTPEAKTKQPASTVVQPHRDGMVRTGEVLVLGSSEKEIVVAETADVEWARFIAEYPIEGRLPSRLAEGMFLSARASGVTFASMLEALDNHKASARWADGKIPNLTTWFEQKRWGHRLPPPKNAKSPGDAWRPEGQ